MDGEVELLQSLEFNLESLIPGIKTEFEREFSTNESGDEYSFGTLQSCNNLSQSTWNTPDEGFMSANSTADYGYWTECSTPSSDNCSGNDYNFFNNSEDSCDTSRRSQEQALSSRRSTLERTIQEFSLSNNEFQIYIPEIFQNASKNELAPKSKNENIKTTSSDFCHGSSVDNMSSSTSASVTQARALSKTDCSFVGAGNLLQGQPTNGKTNRIESVRTITDPLSCSAGVKLNGVSSNQNLKMMPVNDLCIKTKNIFYWFFSHAVKSVRPTDRWNSCLA